LTETSPMATAIPNDHMDKRESGVSRIIWSFRFVDPKTIADVAIKSGGLTEPAEIWFRGPSVTQGYCKNEEATKDAVYIDSDGTK
jgi:long-subunit acyl-CoA synthetase (AMP-forming)